MYLGSSDSQAQSVSRVLQNRMTAYESLQSTLREFAFASPSLSGHTYDSAKAYSQQVLTPLLQGCILLDEAIKEACLQLPAMYRNQVDSIDLKESELVENIYRSDRLIGRYQELIRIEYHRDSPDYGHIHCLRQGEANHQQLKMRLEEKLRKLREFNTNSSHIFSNITALADAVNTGLSQAKTAWNASSKSFMIPPKSEMKWAEDVNGKWKQRIDIVEAGIDYLIKPDFISKGAETIHPHAKTAYLMGKNFLSAVSKDYKKSGFMKYGKMGMKTNDDLKIAWRSVKKLAKDKNWKWYKNLGSKWKKGSFNQFLNTVNHSVTSKVANFKVFGKYPVKNINAMLGKITDPIKTYGTKLFKTVSKSKIANKLKFLGKAAKTLGWVAMGVDITVTSIREYNNKDSRAYGSVGKSLIHAGVAQLKSAGPIEGAMAGATFFGPPGAIVGFIGGALNTVWGIVAPQHKDKMYSGLQNLLDDGYDTVKQGLGKAVKGTWKTMTSWFGGGLKHA